MFNQQFKKFSTLSVVTDQHGSRREGIIMDIAIAIAASMGKIFSSVLEHQLAAQESGRPSLDGSVVPFVVPSDVLRPVQDDVVLVDYEIDDVIGLTEYFVSCARDLKCSELL
jgi:hypothetical protein